MKFAVVYLILLLSAVVSPQTLTEQSYRQAREVLDRSVAAYGGLEKLRAIKGFQLKASGDTVQRNQSRKPFASDRTPYSLEIVQDTANNRSVQVTNGGYPGGFRYHSGFAVDKTDGVSFDLIRKVYYPRPNVPATVLRARSRYVPQFVVLNAVDRSSRLRYLGPNDFQGRPHDVVSYANEDGVEIALYIDKGAGLLTKFETLGTDPFAGDVVFENIFTGYKNDRGNRVAIGRSTRVGGELVEELRYDQLTFDPEVVDTQFKAPAGLEAGKPAPQSDPVRKLAENVFTVTAGGYNVLFVGFRDYIFVMEAPGNDGVSRQAIEQIKKMLPGKPIRYVSVTHHHDDHAGGIRRYIAEGATLIAAPGEKPFFEKVVKSRFTIDPDILTLNPQPLKVEVIENGKRVLTDGTVTVEILDIGPGPHAEEMLVAYLPNEKILFQGDLLNRPANGDYPIANDTTAHFARWIETKKLAVERIVPVHGTVTTMVELRKAVAEMQAARK